MARPGQKKKAKQHEAAEEFDVLPLAKGHYAYLIGEGKTTHVKTDSDEFKSFIHEHDLTDKIQSFANLYGLHWTNVVEAL